MGYNWGVIVSVDDRQVWEYQSHPFESAAVRQSGISCAESPQLPEGRLNFSTRFTYWS